VNQLPAEVDWRNHKVVTPVKNQGGCGSCWAFSTAETLESHIAIKTGKLFELSEQQFVSCLTNPKQCGGTGGCQGATPWIGFNYTVHNGGVTSNESYPYTSGTGTVAACEAARVKPVAKITGYERLPANNYSALMNAVATVGPIAISGAAEPWQFYSHGIFDGRVDHHPYDVDHAIQLVGYGGAGSAPYPPPQPQGSCGSVTDPTLCKVIKCHYCNSICEAMPCNPDIATLQPSHVYSNASSPDGADGEGAYWLVRNSWGALWGEQGYIRIARFGDTPKGEPCGVDVTPSHGSGCAGGPAYINVCGVSGIMSDSSYPTGGSLSK